jgi:hypothetical protein
MRTRPRTTTTAVLLLVLAASTARAASDPARTCAAAKLKAVGKDVNARLKCIAAAARTGRPLDLDCLATASAKQTAAFAKAEAKGGCLATLDGTALEVAIRGFVAQIAAAIPSAPPCAQLGSACGICGDGACVRIVDHVLAGDLGGFCLSFGSQSDPCNASGDCAVGEACMHPLGTCMAICPGCEDGNPCSVDFVAGGVCTHSAAANGTPCPDVDGNACTAARCDTSAGFVCDQTATMVACSDGNPCTTDRCNALVGECETSPVPNGTVCGLNRFCLNGLCIGGG